MFYSNLTSSRLPRTAKYLSPTYFMQNSFLGAESRQQESFWVETEKALIKLEWRLELAWVEMEHNFITTLTLIDTKRTFHCLHVGFDIRLLVSLKLNWISSLSSSPSSPLLNLISILNQKFIENINLDFTENIRTVDKPFCYESKLEIFI